MYSCAKEIIQPGISELDVYSELHDAGCQRPAGEALVALGNDFQCGTPGGPARQRRAENRGNFTSSIWDHAIAGITLTTAAHSQ